MTNQKKKFLITLLLVVIAIVLFFVKVFIPVRSVNTVEPIKVKKLTDDEIKQIVPFKIDSVCYTFGIKKEGIKTINESEAKLTFSKQIDIPADLSPLQVEYEVEQIITAYGLTASSTQDYPSTNLYTDIIQQINGEEKVIGKVEYRNNVPAREVADICFVLNGIENYPEKTIEKVLSSIYRYSIVFPNNVEKSDVQAMILDSKKDYILMFEIGTPEDFSSDFKRDKDWRAKVYSVCGDYDKDIPIVFSNPQKLFEFENELMTELLKCKDNNIFRDTIFRKIKKTEKSLPVELLFMDVKMKLEKGVKKMLYLVDLSAAEVDIFFNECFKLERKGNKLKPFSAIVKSGGTF